MIISSGSFLDSRDTIFLFDVKREKLAYKKNVRELYKLIQTKMGILQGGLINIEATAATDSDIFMFHRGTESKQNYMIRFKKNEFIDYLINDGSIPNFYIAKVEPPISEQFRTLVTPGISGANSINNNQLLVSYSMEMTESNYSDGEILGSYFGILNLNDLSINSTYFKDQKNHSEHRKIKVEGIVYHKKEANNISLSVVSDNDNDASQFIQLKASFDSLR